MLRGDDDARRRIGELAAELGLNPKTIRYYEAIGLLPEPRRTPAGYRCYGVDDRERLRFIAQAKAIGLSLQEISEILAIRQAGNPPCRHVAAVLDRKLAVLEARIRSLTDLHREITELRRDTAGMVSCDATICAIIEHHDRIAEPLDLPVDWKD
jgi:DNA-binding transcriptional MerR regulator